MRDIKFRCWDKKGKFIFYPEYIGLKDGNCIRDTGRSFDDFEIMQYTGKKDKNDKEIYDGDIVKIDNKTGWIIWGGIWGHAGFVVETDKPEPPNTGKKTSDFLNPQLASAIEIIGNIYENPEIINDK